MRTKSIKLIIGLFLIFGMTNTVVNAKPHRHKHHVVAVQPQQPKTSEADTILNTSNKKINPKKHKLKGKATYYGLHYSNGRRTASGIKYDKNKLTAAHRTLPFGTKVQVKNLRNGKTVCVIITDRGPFGKGKIIDLSVKAAREIGILKRGVTDVELSIM